MSSDTLFGADDPANGQQWRLARLQVINWGPFDGHHSLDIPTDGICLITGGSGTGKSSLLDAITATMMPSTAHLNSASQEAAAGGDREDDRTVLSYARGQYEKTRDENGSLVRLFLRDDGQRYVWAAVAMTWQTADGTQTFTAGRAWLVPPSARNLEQAKKRLFTVNGPLDLAALEPAATAGLSPGDVRSAAPGIEVWPSYNAFRAELGTRLRIGQGGDAERPLRLLAKIQQGRPFASIDSLFQHLVLDEPESLERGREAVSHFADLRDAHQAMLDSSAKIDMLGPIENYHERLQAAISTQAAVSGLRPQEGPQADTVFGWWVAGLQRQTAERAAAGATARQADAEITATTARAAADASKEDSEALAEALRAAGGDKLEALQRNAADAEERSRTIADRREAAAAQLAALGDLPTTAEEWNAMVAAAQEFQDDLPDERSANAAQQEDLKHQAYRLSDRLRRAREERASLDGRASRIAGPLHAQRAELAARMGVNPDDLPFVAELLDMADGHEPWRKAAELALGGFATTLLVDDRDLTALRRAVNDLRWRVRVRFAGAHTGQPLPAPADPATLPGRLVTKPGSPFAGWLAAQIADRFDFECVDSPGQLDQVGRGLTVTGQTSEGRRGAHGGNARPAILGFSNTERIADLDCEIRDLTEKLGGLQRDLKALQDNEQRWHDREVAAGRITMIGWADIDLAGARERAERLRREIEQITSGNDQLRDLQRALQVAEESTVRHRRVQYAQENEAKKSEEEAAQMRQAADRAAARATALAERGLQASEQQEALLSEQIPEPPDTLKELDSLLEQAKRKLPLAAGNAANNEKVARDSLKGVFDHYIDRFGDHGELGTDPLTDYPAYLRILEHERAEGLPDARNQYLKRIGRWSTEDLLRVLQAMKTARASLTQRLDEVNSVLANLPFGPRHDRLEITSVSNASAEVRDFERLLRQLASQQVDRMTPEQADELFVRVSALVDRLGDPSFANRVLDVRKHVVLEAHQYDQQRNRVGVTTTTKSKSGGEAQETMAFVLAAALRFALSDLTSSLPPYAPVILDEGYIKADMEFTDRAITAWTGVGFQVIAAAPPEKVGSFQEHAPRIWQIAKGNDLRARAIPIDRSR